MNADYKHAEVRNNEGEQRYEVSIDDQLAVLEYERKGNHITYIHTGVPSALEGHGVASMLAHTALEDARKERLSVTPRCPFVASYIREHTEYLPLLSEAEQAYVQQEG